MMSEIRETVAGEEGVGVCPPETGGSFEWDDESQLYFHASSGFYHDPDAGWYYSSRDCVYYRFENGNYVLLDSLDFNTSAESGGGRRVEDSLDEPTQSPPRETHPMIVDDNVLYNCNAGLGNLRPPSEWLEETLINIYLTGHLKPELDENITPPDVQQHGERSKDGFESHTSTSNGFSPCHAITESWEIEGNQDISDGIQPFTPDDYLNEENWKAQFGQVVKPEDENPSNFSVIDLWDWSLVSESEKQQEVRLVGRLVRRSKSLHPSLPAAGLLKTAKIREVHLDLVGVATGKIYRLRNPSSGYLASLPAFDASDPTKDWGFPNLNISSMCKSYASQISNEAHHEGSSTHHLAFVPSKSKYSGYRDRAAERRALHGGYGIGPGQKRQKSSEEVEETKLLSEIEAINMSCGPGSYSRRILESMGWKEGEAFGRRKVGLLKPLQAIGNTGNMGLGWKGMVRIGIDHAIWWSNFSRWLRCLLN